MLYVYMLFVIFAGIFALGAVFTPILNPNAMKYAVLAIACAVLAIALKLGSI